LVRAPLLFVALPLLATFAPLSLQRRDPPPPVSLIRFEPVPLEEGSPDASRLGRLRFLGGWALTSNDARFGGISALHLDSGGVLALSDAGWHVRFPLPRGASTVRAEIAMTDAGPGPADEKENRDAESLTVEGDRLWVGYEQANAVWRYRRSDFAVQAHAAPAAMDRWKANHGPEAMVRLADGRFLIFNEGTGGDSEALLFAGDPAAAGTRALRLRYRPPAGYSVTDAALLPDGRLALLHRRFRLFEGLTARLSVARLPRPVEGAVIEGAEIAAFEGPITRDNFEALSATREGGRTILWIASDDNYNNWQRTLLMKFALVGSGN
jgi:hypothetical protein